MQTSRGIGSRFGLQVLLLFSLISSMFSFGKRIKAEDDYVRLYGNNPRNSGKWKPFSKTKNSYPELMKNVCIQAHEIAGFGPPTASVRSAFHSRNTLRYLTEGYRTVTVDYIKYGLGIGETDFLIHYLWYITKGLRPDCVFYLDKVDMEGFQFQLTNIHICGIRMPEWPDNVNYDESSMEM